MATEEEYRNSRVEREEAIFDDEPLPAPLRRELRRDTVERSRQPPDGTD